MRHTAPGFRRPSKMRALLVGVAGAALMLLALPLAAAPAAAATAPTSAVALAGTHSHEDPVTTEGVFASGVTARGVFAGRTLAQSAPSDLAKTDENAPKTDFFLAGFISFQDKPLEGVHVSVKGNGFSAETKTGADGSWKLYVPAKGTYTLTVDETTLPKGVIVAGESASQEVEFGLTNSKFVNLFLGQGVRKTVPFIDQLIDRTVNGINFGLLLGLASMGAALIYGTTRLANFAHAELVTWGGVVALIATSWWHLPLWAGIVAAIAGGALLGLALDAGLFRPLRHRGIGLVQVMIVSIGLSLALRYFFQFLIGGGTEQLPGASPTPFHIGPVEMSYIDVVSMSVSLISILAVTYFLTRTRIGRATRAISDNPELAAASGINVDRVIRIVWILAGALAAVSGILWAYFRPGVKWDMGVQMLLLIFAAMTLGGLSTAFGALVGSLIVGIAVEVSTLWIPSDLKYASALVAMIVILLVRPQGLLGHKERLG